MPPLLSIIIPAHNEETRLPQSLEAILEFVHAQPYQSEIIVVENGSSDRTAQISQDYAARHPEIQALQELVAGKGLAVRRGMLAAKGDFRFICDADLSMPIEEVNLFLPPQAPPFDVAIASREIPGAVRYDEPYYRHLIGRAFNLLVQVVTLPGLQDTQCGFKCFQADAAEELFPVQTIAGWTFDVEVLFIAKKRGMQVIEIPINWHFDSGSRVSILRDSATMFADLFRIRLNNLNGIYDKK
ncbi:MAG TPA: dolichyl-phosphate beta-glucosyltransferase [Anaerolineales bacterium]|nr:glycosyltransferase family 2 protein [Anaerolineales bacterium]HUS83722.1 dolichyl-phosphate beta-glucosyltransferase [Anaerolineales bacterium]